MSEKPPCAFGRCPGLADTGGRLCRTHFKQFHQENKRVMAGVQSFVFKVFIEAGYRGIEPAQIKGHVTFVAPANNFTTWAAQI